jgi:hypothetical protein
MSNRCKGWVNPTNLYYGPQIVSLSSYQSPSGSSTVVAINGYNFCYGVTTISFGTFFPTVFFVNSNILEFYVPNTLSSGTFPVQVFNGSIGSNIVTYTIDNASGYWLLNSNNNISNTNSNGIATTWLSRGIPVTLTTSTYTVPNNVNWIIGDSISTISVTLPFGMKYAGRELTIKTINIGTITANSDSPIIQPLAGGTATNTIVSGVGKWVTLVSDGSTWYIMAGN